MVKTYEASNLNRRGIRHGFFTRAGGVSGGLYGGLNVGRGSDDDADAVRENRRRAAEHLAPGTRLCTAYQVHGNAAIRADDPWPEEVPPKADALVATRPGIAIGILTADCVPVLLAASCDRGSVVGAAHAGWRGALGGVTESVLLEMEATGIARADIHAAVGPAIAQGSYEVGEDVRAAFMDKNPDFDTFFAPNTAGRFQLDLVGFVRESLATAGIASVELVRQDTYTGDDEFYSYRRSCHREEPDYGRQLSAITIL